MIVKLAAEATQLLLLVQVLLERCIHAGSTSDLGLSYPELNKAVEDPLSTHHSDESLETVLDAPLTMESAMHLHVPLSLLDHELDLSRHASLYVTSLVNDTVCTQCSVCSVCNRCHSSTTNILYFESTPYNC